MNQKISCNSQNRIAPYSILVTGSTGLLAPNIDIFLGRKIAFINKLLAVLIVPHER